MSSLKSLAAAAAAALLALTIPAAYAQEKAAKERSASKKSSGQLAKNDLQSFRKMAQADMAEVAAGKVAAEKAQSPEVKKYAQHMVDEHSKMLEEGKQLAQSKGVTPPAQPEKKHQAALQKLQKASGADFDRQYMQQMVKDHQEVLKVAEKTAKDAKDAQLKAHAQKGVPHIKEHLAQARKISESLGAGAGGTSDKSAPKGKK
jgi:putative membrane protein